MSARIISFTLPMPPSSNGAFFNIPGRGRVATKKLKNWRIGAAWELQLQRMEKRTEIKPPVELSIFLQKEDNRKRDADNFVKQILDLLVANRVIPDDNSEIVKKVSVEWVPPGMGPACRVELRSVEA